MWRVYAGAIMAIAGIAAFVEARAHRPTPASGLPLRTLGDAVDLISQAQERARRGERAELSMGIVRVTAVAADRLQVSCDLPEELVGNSIPTNRRSLS